MFRGQGIGHVSEYQENIGHVCEDQESIGHVSEDQEQITRQPKGDQCSKRPASEQTIL